MLYELQHTLMIFDDRSRAVYRDITQNANILQEYDNLCQVWFLIIKKSLFEREYEVSLMKVELINSGRREPS